MILILSLFSPPPKTMKVCTYLPNGLLQKKLTKKVSIKKSSLFFLCIFSSCKTLDNSVFSFITRNISSKMLFLFPLPLKKTTHLMNKMRFTMLNHLKNLDLLVYKSTREEAIKTTKIPKFCHFFWTSSSTFQKIPKVLEVA